MKDYAFIYRNLIRPLTGFVKSMYNHFFGNPRWVTDRIVVFNWSLSEDGIARLTRYFHLPANNL
jgi:hypothetical protein